MRLQSILLLAAAAILVSVDASATAGLKTTQARSLTSTGRDAAGKRLLRPSAIADTDDEDERALINFSRFRKWLNSDTAAKISTKASTSKVASKIAAMDDHVDDLNKLSSKEAFTKLKLDHVIDDPDALFTNPNFKRWMGHMVEANRGAETNDGMTVAKFLREQQGDDALAKMLAQASNSNNPAVRDMGSGIQIDHLKQMIKAGQSPDVVVKIPALSDKLKADYKTMWDVAIANANRASKKTKEKLKANEAAVVL